MISFIIPTRNNLPYLQLAYNSIRDYYPNYEIIILDDNSTDFTSDWLWGLEGDITQDIGDKNLIVYRNTGRQVGHTVLYDIGVELCNNEIFTIFHADMVCGPNYVENLMPYLKEKTVVSATRIEPPLHPEGKEKITKDFGTYVEDFKSEEFKNYCIELQLSPSIKNITSRGIFAPWAMYKKDFLSIGGHDKLFSPFPYEDSDLFQRLILAGYNIIQSRDSFVWHFTCRGHRWSKEVKKDDIFYKICCAKNASHFLRKWGTWIQNDENSYPIIHKKYDFGFVVNNSNLNILTMLEPLCSTIYVDSDITDYINKVQPGTPFDMKLRVKKYDEPKSNNILIYFDGNKLTNENYPLLTNLSKIISESGEVGVMEYDIFKFHINSLQSYENNFIHNNNEYYTKQFVPINASDPYFTNTLFEIYNKLNKSN